MIREERRKKRKRKRIMIVMIALFLVLLAAGYVVMEVFVVEDVEVEGNVIYGSEAADAAKTAVMNDKFSWNSLYVFLKYKFVDVERVPFIDTMEISLTNPKTVHIKVYEKGIMGYLYIPSIEENAYFDKDGFVVETSKKQIDDIPMIRGIDCSEVVLYEQLPIDADRLREILTLTQALKRAELIPDSVTFALADAPALRYGGIEVRMGGIAHLTQKIERLGKIMPKLAGEEGTLHVETWTEETPDIWFERKNN